MSNHEQSFENEDPATLWERILKYKLAILSIGFLFIGSILIILGEERVGYVGRDIGIALVIAGTVGLSVEYAARKEAERVLRYIAKDSIEKHAWPKLREISESIQGYGFRASEGVEKVLSMSQNVESQVHEINHLLINNNLRTLGVKQMHINRSPDLLEYIQQAPPGSTIKLLAISLNRLIAEDAGNVLRQKLKEGCTVQVLVMDPESPYVRVRALEEMDKPEATETEIEQFMQAFVEKVRNRDSLFRNWAKNLPVQLQSRIEISHYDAPANCFLVDNTLTMLVGFYLRSFVGEECPHIELEIREGGAYLSFRRHFEFLWKNPVLVERRKESIAVEVERRRPEITSDLSPEVTH